jgi:hypothetical protein
VSLTFFSASLPRKPMRVILLRYIRFSCSARLSRAPECGWAWLSRPEAAFLGGPKTGEPEPERCHSQSRSFAGTGRRKRPEAVPRQRVEKETTGNSHDMVGPNRRTCNVRSSSPCHRLESAPHLRAAAARHHAKTEMMAALRHSFYAACRHV